MTSSQFGDHLPTEIPKAQLDLVAALEQVANTVVLRRGAVLFHQGQQPSSVFVVRKGRVRLTLFCGDGELAYQTVGPGYILGLPATVSDQPYSLTAETVEDSEFASVDRKLLLLLLDRRNDLMVQVVAILADELRRMRNQASALAGAKTQLLSRRR